jgi:hypothetical protein
MKTKELVRLYEVERWTLRMIAEKFNTNHHLIKRRLEKLGVKITRRNTLKEFTQEHKDNISRACKGRKSWSKGKKMSNIAVLKNMKAHIRFDVSLEWLQQFDDTERLKFLNGCITDRSGRFVESREWYMAYIEKFYSDQQFNDIYKKWIESGKEKYRRPTIDHIVSRAKGGTNSLGNLQFLTWFENRSKNDMSQDAWDNMKNNIQEYFI